MLVNEQIWLQELGKGEANAYRELFRLFYARLGNLAFHFVEERAVAEDIVQDILYELWTKKLHFENFISLKVYLYRMVRSRCLDILKHRKVEKKYFQELRHKEDSEFFLHQFLEDELYILLKKAISSLPCPLRRIFELVLDGCDNTEIAGMLHLSVDAVKSHKKRGKKILQEKLKGFILLYALFSR